MSRTETLTALASDPRALVDAVAWQLRGLLGTDRNRRFGYKLRDLCQPAEVEARRGMGRELLAQVSAPKMFDPAVGYMMLPADAMPDLSTVCTIGQAKADEAAQQQVGTVPGGKTFSRFRFTNAEEVMSLIKVGLDRRLLAMATNYFGVLPVLSEADFFCAFPVEGPFKKSQLWHCDHDAERVLKIFIYCEAVGEEDGPFELVEAAKSLDVRTAIGYRYAGARYRVADNVMTSHVPESQQLKLTGPEGTAFVADTAHCFHRGSRIRAAGHRRIAAMVCYVPPNGSKLPLRLASRRAPLFEYAKHFTDAIDRAVLGVPVSSRWV